MNLIKMPLIRVEHPSEQHMKEQYKQVQKAVGIEDDVQVEEAGAPPVQYPPALFNFDHYYDRDLMPQKEFEKLRVRLESQLDQELKRGAALETEKLQQEKDHADELHRRANELKDL